MVNLEVEIECGYKTEKGADGKDVSVMQKKKYHFREELMCLDYVMIGLPLMDMQKFMVKDPITGEKVFVMDQSKLEEQDLRALNKWNLNFLNQMNLDNINWEKSRDIYAMNQLLAHPKIQKLIENCMRQINPNVSPISEKKS